ncbi:GTPase of uncharacterised function family protein [Helicobacter acinonychis]|nr:GTPase of uncharacterised function family protein [Helicobacter acinonychis]
MGDGRSDFTLKTQSYHFKYGNQDFVLLNVPSIESDEEKVIEQISDATQKAHAVFISQKVAILRKKEKRIKKGQLKKFKNNLIRKQRYRQFLTNRLTAQEP